MVSLNVHRPRERITTLTPADRISLSHIPRKHTQNGDMALPRPSVAVVSILLSLAHVDCTDRPANIEVGEDSITVRYLWSSYTVPLEHTVIQAYQNIPTPTVKPPKATVGSTATPVPTYTPQPTPTPTTEGTEDATPVTIDQWWDDSVFPQLYGSTVSMVGALTSFGAQQGWILMQGPEMDFISVDCNFSPGYAARNQSRFEEVRDHNSAVFEAEGLYDDVGIPEGAILFRAIGRVGTPPSARPIGFTEQDVVNRVGNNGLSDCTLAEVDSSSRP